MSDIRAVKQATLFSALQDLPVVSDEAVASSEVRGAERWGRPPPFDHGKR